MLRPASKARIRNGLGTIALALVVVVAGSTSGFANSSGFDSEQPAGLQINPKHQTDWEPTVAIDPGHANLIYQLITGINATACSRCPGTSVLLRKSTDGGKTWGPETFVCPCKGVGWQFDPQIKVANDTNAGCDCGTIYVVFMDTYDPGAQLFKSSNGGVTWSAPVTMNGGLKYMDKPVLVISPSGKDVYVAFNDKLSSMVVASHDHGRTFLPPQKVNSDGLWWYANAGAIAPNGDVYFALDGETGSHLNVGSLDGPDEIAVLRCSPDPSVSCGSVTATNFGTSASPPSCDVFQCYPDYFAATGSIAIDSAGHMALAYTFNEVANGPKTLFVRRSSDGVTWSAPVVVNAAGDSNVPQIANGPTAGDFRLAWQDNRTGEYNTWLTRSTNGGASWGTQVKLSNKTSGAPYKSSAGYTFTDGDYFGLAVNSAGTNFVIWGEADGSSIYCCGDVWYTRGG